MSQEHEIVIKVDKQEYRVAGSTITGQALRQLANVGSEYDLWLRARGQEDDSIIGPDNVITIEPGMHFYTAKAVITPGGCR